MNIYDHNYAIGRPYCNLQTKLSGNVTCKRGEYWCKQGIISIYSEQGHRNKKINFVSLSTIHNGREYHRSISKKEYTDIGIARKAGEFAREIFNPQRD